MNIRTLMHSRLPGFSDEGAVTFATVVAGKYKTTRQTNKNLLENDGGAWQPVAEYQYNIIISMHVSEAWEDEQLIPHLFFLRVHGLQIRLLSYKVVFVGHSFFVVNHSVPTLFVIAFNFNSHPCAIVSFSCDDLSKSILGLYYPSQVLLAQSRSWSHGRGDLPSDSISFDGSGLLVEALDLLDPLV